MQSNRNRTRRRFELEALEERVALSHMGALVEDGPHHNRGGNVAEVHSLRHGADDSANHDVNDVAGADDPANHDVNDVAGADDPANHDVNGVSGAGATTTNGGTVVSVHGGGGTEAVHHHRGGGGVSHVNHHGEAHPAGHR
jgi:hypothetical protein